MGSEVLTQDEIDALISLTNDTEPVIMSSLSSIIAPQIVSNAKTMLKRYYYTLTHCGFEEQRIAKNNLREAAFKIWLNRYGFVNRSDYIDFINNEARKRGLNWKLCLR